MALYDQFTPALLATILCLSACSDDAALDGSVVDTKHDATTDGGTAAPDTTPASSGTLMIEGPDLVAVSACAAYSVTLLDADGKPTSTTTDLPLTLDGPSELFTDAACKVPLTGTQTMAQGEEDLTFSARFAAPGKSKVRASHPAPGSSELPIDVAPRFEATAYNKRALIVYNKNHPDAGVLAEYYRKARSIDPTQVCPVTMPPGVMATPVDLLRARDTIVETCICPLIPAAKRPNPCDVTQATAVAAGSPISHLVLVAGLPLRLTKTGWTQDNESPSLGPYLASLLYRNVPIFGDDSKRQLTVTYPKMAPVTTHPERLDPATTRWAAFGYLQANDLDRTRKLIDRTLEAERAGIDGNVLVGEANNTVLSRFLIDLTSSHDAACSDYLTHQPFVFGSPASSWPYKTCRYGTTYSSVSTAPAGSIPGEIGSTIPNPIDVGLLLATSPGPNSQIGFDGFEVMRRWHRAAPGCVELCDDHPTSAQVATCKGQSTDLFQELDTSCVGVSPGFMGFQLRSWPVQYIGFLPPGWSTRESGALVKSVPRTIPNGGFKNARFSDDSFVRFGVLDPGASTPTCDNGSGGTAPCPEQVVGVLSKTVTFNPPLPFISGERSFTIRVRFRNPASPGGALIATGVFEAGGTDEWRSGWNTFDAAHPSWTTLEFTATAHAADLNNAPTLPGMSLVIRVIPDKPSLGWLDVDGVELIDDTTKQALIAAEVGGFAAKGHQQNVPGDFASNVIDRLGGIAAWGSSSHFLTGGWAFKRMDRSIPMLFAGRTLGESLLAATRLESGLLFGDPLYRPVAVRLRPANGSSTVSFTNTAEWDALRSFKVDAMLGTSHLDDLRWSLETCDESTVATCATKGSWVRRRGGAGAVEDLVVDANTLRPPAVAPEQWYVRLRVWRAGDAARALSSIVRVLHDKPK